MRFRRESGGDAKCRVCGSDQIKSELVKRPDLKQQQLTVFKCSACGYNAIPGNTHDYTTAKAPKDFGLAPRVGTMDKPGREFGMAKVAVPAVSKPSVDVLVYGIGRSLDNVHIAKIPTVRTVAIGDVANFRQEAEFVDITQPAARKFDVVIACEVIEHFLEPHEEFERLFSYVADDGLLVCSTNIHDGAPLVKQSYIFGRGHVAYYSPGALRVIATANNFELDFRVPLTATGRVGKRKRYVLFSRSPEVMRRVADYFGRVMYAPSEAPLPKRTAKKKVHEPAK